MAHSYLKPSDLESILRSNGPKIVFQQPVRGKSEKFRWLDQLSDTEEKRFYEELYQILADSPLIGIGCVIDRPGYNHRYREKYGRQRWLLCKTTFSVTVERAAKYARSVNRKLRVYVERSDVKTDRLTKQYYQELRTAGMPFAKDTSVSYDPLTADMFHETLYDFDTKAKSSPMAQFADLYLWPICMGGYNPNVRPYRQLIEDGKLIDCHLSESDIPTRGIKYSCWDLVS